MITRHLQPLRFSRLSMSVNDLWRLTVLYSSPRASKDSCGVCRCVMGPRERGSAPPPTHKKNTTSKRSQRSQPAKQASAASEASEASDGNTATEKQQQQSKRRQQSNGKATATKQRKSKQAASSNHHHHHRAAPLSWTHNASADAARILGGSW